MIAVSYLKYETDLVDQMQNRINRMYSSIHGLWFDMDSLYEFMRALASEQLNPMIIPPDILRNILQEVQNDIRTNAHLKLPNDPMTKIWSYYGTTKLTPIVLEDYLMLILTIPLVDSSLQMNLYKVHNLPHSSPWTEGTSHLWVGRQILRHFDARDVCSIAQWRKYQVMHSFQGTFVSLWPGPLPSGKCHLVYLRSISKWLTED